MDPSVETYPSVGRSNRTVFGISGEKGELTATAEENIEDRTNHCNGSRDVGSLFRGERDENEGGW